MTVLESAFEQVSDDIEAGRVKHYEYNLKIDIVLEEGIETVHGKVLLIKTLETIKKAPRGNEVIEFYDVEGTQVTSDLKGIKSHDISKRFCVESIGGKTKVLLFGVRIQSSIPFSVIKDRIIPLLKPLRTYMKIHHAGFEHGVNWSPLGFFINTHPNFNDKMLLLTHEVITKLEHGWYHDTKFWTDEKKHEIKTLFESPPDNIFRPTDIPFAMVPANANSKFNDNIINVSTTMLVIPNKFLRAGIQLMDYLLLEAKTTTSYVPLGLKQNDKQTYHTILKAHSQWMENHRNIQILFTAPYYDVVSASGEKEGSKSVIEILQAHPDVLGYHIDEERSRINVSVDHLKFRAAQQSIQQAIQAQEFIFDMQVKMPRNATTTEENSTATASTVTMQSKYHHALSSIITTASNATIDDTNTLQSTKSAWKRRTSVPIVIDFNNEDLEQFPPLTTTAINKAAPPRTINTNASQANENASDTLTITTVNNAVTEALAAAKEEHRSEMEALRTELRDLKVTFQILAQTIATQSETIMHHLQLNNTTAAPTKPTTENDEPSPPRKRRDKGNNKKTPTRHNMSSKLDSANMQKNTSCVMSTDTAINRRLEWHERNQPGSKDDDDMSDTTDYSHSTNDESSRQIEAIIARASDSINGDEEGTRPEEEITFEREERPQAIDAAPNEKAAATTLPPSSSANTTTAMETSTTENDETFYSYTNPSAEDDFFEMMSTHSNDAAGENNVSSTQEDTKMSSGRED